jgi:toxin CptA
VEEVCCEFKYSGAAFAFLAAAALGTLTLIACTPFPDEVRLPGAAWVIALALHSWRTFASSAALRLDCAGAIALRGRSGEWRNGTVRDGCFVAPWLTIVRWRPDGARHDRTVVILPDMLPAEAMRKIRVILKWA